MEISQPVTELSNQITKDIDTSSIPDCLEMLCKCDREMFNGWSGFGGLYSDENMCSGLKLASHLRHCRKTGGRIILAGCGTSGRLAFIISVLNVSSHPYPEM